MKAKFTRDHIDKLIYPHKLTEFETGTYKDMHDELIELEAKAAKWDVIQWAIEHETRFIECSTCGDDTFLAEIDLERIERLYKEREQNEC